ncbi:MAG TPA: molybdate ABC transporter substrate-binding protein [Abditibacteriaceae bacterium]|jgi:molybdate transport system substrate-binding protein
MKHFFLLLVLLAAIHSAHAQTLTVSAAASLRDVMVPLGKMYQKKNPRVRLRFNLASSGALQRQIENGAPVDVFISAAAKNVVDLIGQGLALDPTRETVARNRLVLVVPRDSVLRPRRFRDVLSPRIRRIAVGATGVPAGDRAREVFSKLGIWPRVARKAIRTRDVREALTQVQLGNVEAGVVYASDAAMAPVRVAAMAPASMHEPIVYPAIVVTKSRNRAAARDFVRFLKTPQASAQFRRFHFLTF